MLRAQWTDDTAIVRWSVRNLAQRVRNATDRNPEVNQPPAAAGDLTVATITAADSSSSSARITGSRPAASHLGASVFSAAELLV